MAEISLLIIDFLNRCLVFVFGLLLWPFEGVDPIWPLLLVSLLTGLAMLWVFGRVSKQGRIRQVKKSIQGNLLGVRLFQHNVRVVLGLQGRIFRETLTYLKHSLLPMLVVIPPAAGDRDPLESSFRTGTASVGLLGNCQDQASSGMGSRAEGEVGGI